MKTNILFAAALAFSVSAFAQNSCGIKMAQTTPANSDDKMASMEQSLGNYRVSVIDPNWVSGKQAMAHYTRAAAAITPDGYTMVGNAMFLIKGGHSTGMFNYATANNGALVLINGVVIDRTGQMFFLNDGDSVDMAGIITRKHAPDNVLAAR